MKNKVVNLFGIDESVLVLPHKKWTRISLSIDDKCKITVKCGRLVPDYLLTKYLESKISWITKRIKLLKSQNPIVKHKHTKEEILKLKQISKELVENKIIFLNSKYNFKYNSIDIKTYTTKWGSCSRSGNLTFNYKISLLPEDLQDYLIVHELCHLKEFNHSNKFWDLVQISIPDYKKLSKMLRVGDF